MGLTGFGAIDIMIRSRKNRLQNIIFTVLHYIYALLVFGPMNINISDTFVKSAKIVWSWAPSCYRIQGFQFTYSRGIKTKKY